MQRDKLNLALVTVLTLARFPLVLLFMGSAVYHAWRPSGWAFACAFASLVLAAVTDLFDGYLARKFQVVTRFGAHADPLMDKLYYLTVMPLLVFVAAFGGHTEHAAILLILTVLFLARDQWVTFLRSIGAAHGISGKANWCGKLRTAFNFPLLCAIYYFEEAPASINFFTRSLIYAAEAVGFSLNVLSLYIYSRNYWTALLASLETEPAVPPERTVRTDVKVAALTTMAIGVSHELNNMLTAVLGNIRQAAESTGLDRSAAATLAKAGEITGRAVDLLRCLLLYAGRGNFDMAPTRLDTLVSELEHDLQSIRPAGVTFAIEAEEPLPIVACDRTCIVRALRALVQNAFDAAAPDGTVDLALRACRRTEIPVAEICPGTELKAEGYVVMAVTNTGRGLDETTRDRIFDPFFTTHMRAQGLGLPVVLGCARAHDGIVTVSTQAGRTTFSLLLPLEAGPSSRNRSCTIC